MIYTPYDYQKKAYDWIIEHPGAGLFLKMGLGKTIITLTAINDLIYDMFDISRALVIAPLRVAESTWVQEAAKWEHLQGLTIVRALGAESRRIQAIESGMDVTVINRENVEWLVSKYQKHWPFDMVVIDELSSFKSPRTRRFRALRKIMPQVKRVVGLTGTPGQLIDLWAQVYLLDKGKRLGKTVTGYRERYFTPDKRNAMTVFSWKPKPEAQEAIEKKISDICISMSDKDYLKLPERIDRPVMLQLPDKAMKQYKQLEKDLVLPLVDSAIVAPVAATLSNKLLQMANGAVYDDKGAVQEIHNVKLQALQDIIDQSEGASVLVFYWYKHDRNRLLAHFPTARTLDSGKDVDNWNAGKIPVLFAHPLSAGYGLNLQAGGHIIVWFGLTWSLEQDQQAIARLYRQGQMHGVVVYRLIAKGTIDEDVMMAIERKADGQEALLAAIKAKINEYGEG